MMLYRILTISSFVTFVLMIIVGCGEKATEPFQKRETIRKTAISPVVGIISGQAITRADMWAQLVEASGAEIFRDIALDQAIEKELQHAQLPVVTEQDLEFERNILLRTLENNDATNLELILSAKGYGEHRLTTLCKRTAGLRKLVQPKIKVTEASIKRMYALIYGPQYPSQIIVTSTLEEASEAIQRIHDGELFSTLAATVSIDQSAIRGGTVAPISPADPLWPTSVRDLIQSLPIGKCSSPILINDRWLLIVVTEKPSQQTVKLSEVRDELQMLSKLAMEQLEIDKLSSLLRSKIRSTIIDLNVKKAMKKL
jgi:parvulin-like peptidyl-prolyl isomerase